MASAPPTSALSAIQLAVLQRPRPPTAREAEDPPASLATRAPAAPSPITGGRGRILDITV